MILRSLLVSVGLVGGISAEVSVLSSAERQEILDKLKEVQEEVGGRADKRAGSAQSSFRAAVANSDRAHELYLKCVEKVRFEDQQKSAQDFREWKRRHKEREDGEGFRRVLRHQLNWLLLVLEANEKNDESDSSEADLSALSTRAISALDAIVGDKELQAAQFKALEKSVTESVFALAYGISSEGKWPGSPVKFKEVYEKHILPPLAEKRDVASFRSAWGKWIEQEANLQEARSKEPEKGERSVAYTRFVSEKRPQMLWDLEKKVYELGDEQGAARSMLKHLGAFSGHKNELKWTNEFLTILDPTEENEAEE